jgi:hypothetical protein
MSLKIETWRVTKSKSGGVATIETAREKVIDSLKKEQKRLLGEAVDKGKRVIKLADITDDGFGQVKLRYGNRSVLGGDSCVGVGKVKTAKELAGKIDGIIAEVGNGGVDDYLKKALKAYQEQRKKSQVS